MTQTERYQDLPLEEVIGDRFGRYSKYIIQDRALPDARDGLKPVQRRILYAMLHEGNTNDKPFRKSAKTVGNVIGNYHPHGDSSVYEAMVRMSQDWKLRHMLIEMQGNNGSVDGDPPAAMRYTEARLSAISQELLNDINKNTVEFISNFDDSDTEPVVLPAGFPNLLVNGSTGISAGYATDIPPHALHEALDAVLMRIENPAATIEELMTVIKGPDFPTGGIIQGVDGIKKAYETGKGKIVVRSRTEIETIKGGKEQIVITEIPFEVNKANLVKKIDEQRHDKRLDGIADVRDESDRSGLRIVIEMKKEVDAYGILQFLFKNTDLQVTYNFNMIAIHNRRPTMMTLPLLLDSYIDHQKEVVTRRTAFDLHKAKDRLHIVAGLMKALSILDEVIRTIRASKDKRDAKNNLIAAFEFSEPQAEAIVSLQLYRLTNTDITELQKEEESLNALVKELENILAKESVLMKVIKKELLVVRKKFAEPRKSTIEEEIEEIKVTLDVLIPSEEVIVTVTKDGYIKRTSVRSFTASNGQDFAIKESDYLLYQDSINTQHHLLLFTSKGNYIYQPIHELPDIRWKDLGQHISSIVPLDTNETIINAIGIDSFEQDLCVLTATKDGQIKRSLLSDYVVQRYARPIKTINLKANDEMILAQLVAPSDDVLLTTHLSYSVRFSLDEVPITGVKTGGVKGISLKEDDYVVSVNVIPLDSQDDITLVTHRGAVKKMALKEIESGARAKRGIVTLRELKSNPHKVFAVLLTNKKEELILETEKGIQEIVKLNTLRTVDRYSNGSLVVDTGKDGQIVRVWKQPIEEKE
ncbi:DNA topoisomerase IV subunit A [Psychrobacillus lasiicapitis]|uniref:DNA topoisomerase 4 subunit A n=1 Tax=Psychrobacillus lasiicapitis TaxID=1636719 RepID=A0A544TGZ6_9BACI|nr:DNA topoisomerase IV subunit A [Psychrobacillus lasiicapitis]TQR16711.1 DNA topoisomerase IV subunit A [Psychrobacillus lasiicapitis]GGA27866.1 DNA topoisomerase 4 subunit A [Psychrobacillus lasiicapitis]